LLTALVLGLVAAAAPAPAVAGDEGAGTRHMSAQRVVAAMQPGWNLGNTFDAIGADETAWGNPRVTRELLANIRAQGFRSIRIPVTWGQHQGPAPDYQIDAAFLARVQEVVDWALDEGFYVMINMHHDSWQWVANLTTQHDAVLAQYTAAWRQIAAAFRNSSHRLVLESINEPFFNGTSGDAQSFALLKELNTTFHGLVRSSGGRNATRLLVLPSLSTNADQSRLDDLAATFAELNDPNLAATVHFYGFWPFSVNVAGFTRFDATTRDDLTGTVDRVHATFIARGIPVIIGEYGLLGFDVSTEAVERGEVLKFFEFFGSYARSHGVTTMWWDNGQHFDRTAFVWRNPDLFRQIRTSWTTQSATASTDLLFVGRSAAPAAQTVTLNLNGRRLVRLTGDDGRLVRGRDYAVSGDQLTFTAAALDRLTGDKEYGVNAVLTARFNRGAPWKFFVITYDTPVLSDAAGTAASLVIPAAFNGDRLATMEAKYADGTNAGPHNWTSFKEFGRAYSPDYANGQITLPAAFFNEVNDGTVVLTFHFWSGATLTYTLIRAGDTVTGTA
jgi:aryl-phospho-beta-D-glucosidase BglC (GH1 family)